MNIHDAIILAIFFPLLLGNAVWGFSVVTCPRFRDPTSKGNRFCTACHGFKWPWKY